MDGIVMRISAGRGVGYGKSVEEKPDTPDDETGFDPGYGEILRKVEGAKSFDIGRQDVVRLSVAANLRFSGWE